MLPRLVETAIDGYRHSRCTWTPRCGGQARYVTWIDGWFVENKDFPASPYTM